MQPVYNSSTFIFFIAVVLCFVAGSILLVFSRNKRVNNRWLAGYFIVTGYGLLVAFLLYSRLITSFPWYHTYRTGYIAGFLLMPFSFFYIRSLMQQKGFSVKDLIHFLPTIVFIIDFIPFYFRSAEYKLQQITVDAQNLDTIWQQFSQGWLGIGIIYVPLRIGLTTVYWIVQARMILHAGKIKEGNNLIAENKPVMMWVKILCGLQALFFLPYYINVSVGSKDNFFFTFVTMIAIGISLTIIFLIMQPDILYGLKGIIIKNLKNDPLDDEKALTGLENKRVINGTNESEASLVTIAPQTIEENVSGEIYLSGQKLTSLANSITEHLLLHRSYLKRGYTSAVLASEMNMQPYILSAVINQAFKTNYNDFINGYRINHAKKLIRDGEAKLLTLEALSEQCGFNNRNSFTIAFKKHTGQTPSFFIKQSSSA